MIYINTRSHILYDILTTYDKILTQNMKKYLMNRF